MLETPETPEREWLAEQFEATREHLLAVAYRMLGSRVEAEDAVQEAWLRLSRADARGDAAEVANLGGWLTTVVSRVCLDALRARRARREESLGGPSGTDVPDALVSSGGRLDPEREALLADSVGLALLVVLDRLPPAERVAFVLHDLFDFSFDEIARVVSRSSAATRQLASRARRRVRGGTVRPSADRTRNRARQRDVARAYLAASRDGNLDALLAILDPDVVLRIPTAAGTATEVRGARNVAGGAVAFRSRSSVTRLALIDGEVGAIVAPYGRLQVALRLTIDGAAITAIDIVADRAQLDALELGVLD